MRWAAVLIVVAVIVGGEAAGPQPPLPRQAPLPPALGDATAGEDRLLAALDRASRQREERIQAVLRTTPGVRPAVAVVALAELAAPRRERDRALVELQQAADEWLQRTHRQERDLLDRATPPQQRGQAIELQIASRIAIVECLRDLALAENDRTAKRQILAEALAELAALPREPPAHLRPRIAWLTVFFHAESALMADDTASAADHAARARAAAQAFSEQFPASELLPAVRAMVADLPRGATP
ncbi:MAG: hypothetical protein RMM29_06405 [Planctomycetota bacterium]|nr:hypothetical protein [Planctomycetota bacterium]